MQIPNFHDRREQVRKHHKGRLRVVTDRTPRNMAEVDAAVLHSMSFDWSQYAISHYDGVKCHFAVLRRGAVLYLHDVTEYLHASHGFNRRGIAIEFEGNPKNTNGNAYKESKYGAHEPTLSQIMGGRSLLQWLKENHHVTYVFAHRQAEGTDRSNCPGPHVWYNVAEWGRRIGLNDGGEGYAIPGGKAIPAAWRDPKYDLTLEHMFRP